MQNGYVESLHGRMREELLNESCSSISAMLAAPSPNGSTTTIRSGRTRARIPDPGSLCRDHRRNRANWRLESELTPKGWRVAGLR